jgi:hypothetical protein
MLAMVRAMTRKTREVPYEGDLAKPIREISDKAITYAEWVHRLYLLFSVYKIDPTEPQAFVKLAASLAINHVPGLQFDLKPHPGGRTTEWTDQRLTNLAFTVDEIRKKGDADTDKEACGQLLSGKHHRTWGKPRNYKGTSEQWQRHLQNMLPKGRKTPAYRISTGPPGLKTYYEIFCSGDRTPMKPDENGSVLGALLKSITETTPQ